MSITINGTTGISGVDGSATAPAFQGNDTNTGIFYPAADTVSISTGGSTAITVDTSQNTTLSGKLITASSGIQFSDGSTQTAAASPFGLKNRIINGDMQVWQRGTSITTSGGYTADRWTQVSGNSIAHTQSTDAPAGFQFSLQMVGTGSNINQRIENLNCAGLAGNSITISFYYKNSSGSDLLGFQCYACNTANNFASLTQIGTTQTLSASPSSSWTRYSVTFNNITSLAANGISIYIYRGSSGSATGLLTGVQLEQNTTATPFEWISYGTELMLCQRYFQIRRNGSIFSGTVGAFGFAGSSGTGVATLTTSLPVEMRAFPTVAYTGTVALNRNQANYPITSLSNYMGTSSGFVDVTVSSGLSGGDGVILVGVADAASISFSSEL